jgi:cytoskeletal protein RodZ
MKRCPNCNRTYTDDGLSFCLDDGTLLLSAGGPTSGGAANFDPNATLAYPATRDTSGAPNPPFPTNAPPQQVVPTPQPMQQQQQQTPSWTPAPYVQQGRKKSNPLPWILGIVGVLLVIGIGAIVLLSMAGGSNSNNSNSNNNNRAANNSNNSNNTNRNANNSNNSNANNSNNSNSNTSSTSSVTDDFSSEKWGTGPRAFGSFYADGEYHMHHTVADQYVVIYSPDEDAYKTEDATVKVTVRSVDSNVPTVGYGLVVHGELVAGKLKGYAFLIKNGPDPKYAVMMLESGVQTTLVKPSSSSAIRTGTNPNQLEVRMKGTQLSFYINGQYATSVTDTAGLADSDGRVGFYTSTGGEIAFDDLSVQK